MLLGRLCVTTYMGSRGPICVVAREGAIGGGVFVTGDGSLICRMVRLDDAAIGTGCVSGLKGGNQKGLTWRRRYGRCPHYLLRNVTCLKAADCVPYHLQPEYSILCG